MPNRLPASVLLLEDEAIIAIDAEEMLAACGVSQVSTHGSEDAALAWLSANTPDLAIIDARLKDGLCRGVVGHLVERAVPFIVYSGDMDGAAAEDGSFGKGIWLSKPCTPSQFEETIRQAMASIPEV